MYYIVLCCIYSPYPPVEGVVVSGGGSRRLPVVAIVVLGVRLGPAAGVGVVVLRGGLRVR